VTVRQPRWWVRRSIRLRVTVVATAVLAVGLVVGTFGLAGAFVHTRVAAVDETARTELATISQLTASGELPSPLPVPAAGTSFAQVLDPAGTVLAASASVSRVLAIVPIEQLAGRSGHTFTTTTSTLGSSPLRIAVQTATLRGVPVSIVVAVPYADVTSTLKALRRVLLIALPLVLLAAAFATWLAVGSALQPVDELRAAADAVQASAAGRGAASPSTVPTLPVPVAADELRRLAETLNRMLARLHAAGEQQRTFIADAAHELRSPIASVQTQLEVALTTSTDAAEWPTVAADVLADVQRLSRLADDLLLLARLDARQPASDAVTDLGRIADAHGPSFFVVGDEIALRRLVENLLTNARRHAVSRVDVHVAADADVVVVTIDDDGPGIAAQDRERVFERWVRLDAGRSRDDGGSGLGLPIARSIARAHGGDIVLDTSPLNGLRAELRLPRATRPA
jgi:signal transduction histidine kinase